MIFDKERDIDPMAFRACSSLACDPLAYISCGDNSLAPDYDYSGNVQGRLLKAEIVRECQGLFGGLISTNADITLANWDGKYSTFSETAVNCDNEARQLDIINTSAGIPVRIAGGFRWQRENCSTYGEANILFTGITTGFPELTTTSNGRDTARFNCTDYISQVLASTLNSSLYQLGQPVSTVIQRLCERAGIKIEVLGTSDNNVTAQFEAGKPLSEYFEDLIVLDLGEFYQSEDGKLFYKPGNYRDPNAKVWDYDTWTNVIDLSTQTFTDLANVITVTNGRQETEDGYVSVTVKDEDSISRFGRFQIIITNKLITNSTQATTLGNRYLERYANASQSRELKAIGNPSIQVGDYIELTERYNSIRNGQCCEVWRTKVKYKVCKIVDNFSVSDGWTQSLSVTRQGLVEPFYACISQACDDTKVVTC